MWNVTSWWKEQLRGHSPNPIRSLTVGNSDYSTRVIKWPTVKYDVAGLKQRSISVELANADGALNAFYNAVYTIQNTVVVKFGFTHPVSGNEWATVYSGKLKSVRYGRESVTLATHDVIFELSKRAVYNTNQQAVTVSGYPGDVVWTVCTCYGGLSPSQLSNDDIHLESFNQWSSEFKNNNIKMAVHLEGTKVTETLIEIAKATDSAIWVDTDGKVHFSRWTSTAGNNVIIERGDIEELNIEVDVSRMVNKQFVQYNYNVTSRSYQGAVFFQDDASINSYGLIEDTIDNNKAWMVDSWSAINVAQRKVLALKDPPIEFEVILPLWGVHLDMGETIRLVDSFYDITSESAWRIVSKSFNVDDGVVNFLITNATLQDGFTIDVDYLDAGHRVY